MSLTNRLEHLDGGTDLQVIIAMKEKQGSSFHIAKVQVTESTPSEDDPLIMRLPTLSTIDERSKTSRRTLSLCLSVVLLLA